MEGSKRDKRVLRKEGKRQDERNIASTVKWGGGGAMTKKHTTIFWPTGSILGLQMLPCIRRGILPSKRMKLPVIQVVMLDSGRNPSNEVP
ncbi:hypothetical protein G6F57_012613 [Rhizopus arrhizus]|uniref:Uncharacterized protein n=1 Tax=Rhizopus oryzae TaxID=64495 RepID=A0A9P6WYG9_RHIOR|nr:hypothetical protein G6F23_009668 [Rhizopus arrhizus]KAG1402425.1 hypothetical protein G6F58_010556 [Rhizopus delemar]KAG0762086.1 hypothetical protein G6F24_007064 [Rhizopus arrhizus]KAG0786520.1 hypothetical protein G6F21_008538 [Rhizopus arrhizus]KAG0791286.1 hypothetical protein G6F22_006176 [Rhizopus arrhizus]